MLFDILVMFFDILVMLFDIRIVLFDSAEHPAKPRWHWVCGVPSTYYNGLIRETSKRRVAQ